jgi:hypothetical protein
MVFGLKAFTTDVIIEPSPGVFLFKKSTNLRIFPPNPRLVFSLYFKSTLNDVSKFKVVVVVGWSSFSLFGCSPRQKGFIGQHKKAIYHLPFLSLHTLLSTSTKQATRRINDDQ